MIWRDGLRNTFKVVVCFLLIIGVAEAASYRSVLKRWTREGRDYSFDNLEMRLHWHVTYLSPEFREARREKLASDYEWSHEEQTRYDSQEMRETTREDQFFVAIYAGSNAWPEIGKDTGKWRIVLETGGKRVEPLGLERVSLSEVERGLYPYTDRWSKGFLLRFPKSIKEGEAFSLKMLGVPANSILTW